MTDVGRMSVGELVGKVLADEHADVLRQAVVWLAQELMEAEVTQAAGAGYGERSSERAARRNGYRERAWDTRVGSIELAIPKLRAGSYFPSFLEPRRRSEQALVAVVQEAYVNGVSTRKVDRLVEALGLAGVSKDTVSRLCRGLDEQVVAFRARPLEVAYPYLWLDARWRRSAPAGGSSIERWWSPTAWTSPANARFSAWTWARPRPRRSGGSSCAAWSAAAWPGCSWWSPTPTRASRPRSPKCWAPLAALHGPLPPGCPGPLSQGPAAAGRRRDPSDLPGRQPRGGPAAAGRHRRSPGGPGAQGRPAAAGGRDRPARLLWVPSGAPVQVALDQPLERVNREIGRRTDVVGVFPNDQALIRLAGALLIEQNDEWLISRRYLSEASMAELTNPTAGKELQVA